MTFTSIGIADHNAANAAYNDLVSYCGRANCVIGQDGHYTDAVAEAKYHNVVVNDRAARAFLVTGQMALAGAIGMFILELHHAGKEPPNIPYNGLIVAPARVAGSPAMRIGWRLALP